ILPGYRHGEVLVFNLGHGIHHAVRPEHAGVFLQARHCLLERHQR
ncbi:uroporphyrinogen decarboxylase, partial [Escherichia coli]|nr:uroporphyrinogen decarboxylase [Escherichia coli]